MTAEKHPDDLYAPLSIGEGSNRHSDSHALEVLDLLERADRIRNPKPRVSAEQQARIDQVFVENSGMFGVVHPYFFNKAADMVRNWRADRLEARAISLLPPVIE